MNTEDFCEIEQVRDLFIAIDLHPAENTIIVGIIKVIRMSKRKKIHKYL